MISQSQRAGPSGTTMYDFDYIIDSTRGTKRVLNTVAISQRRLFIANGNIACKSVECSEKANTVATVQKAMKSFADT